MAEVINVYIGKVTNIDANSKSCSAASSQTQCDFYAFIKTLASFVPCHFNETSYTNSESCLEYSFTVQDTTNKTYVITIVWPEEEYAEELKGITVNQHYFLNTIEGINYFKSIFDKEVA